MLYVSTRNKADSFTAYRVLHEDKASDGGLFVPFHLPSFSSEEISALKDQTFSETVANILNLFFSRHLTSWDVEFSIGRYPFRLEPIGQRTTVAELWHNISGDYHYLVTSLYHKLSDKPNAIVPQWVCISVEIAMLFGLYGELLRKNTEYVDIAVADNDFNYSIAAMYAKKMGLPIGIILCGCTDESGLWDFLRRGEAAANVPEGIERLLYEYFGGETVAAYSACRNTGRIYRLNELFSDTVSKGFYPSVIGLDRIQAVTANVYRSFGYTADTFAAVGYAALQDYRAATGENRKTLILSRRGAKE